MADTTNLSTPQAPAVPSTETRSRTPRRRGRVIGAVAAGLVVAGGVGVGYPRFAEARAQVQQQPKAEVSTATVTQRDLARVTKVTGKLGYGTVRPITARLAGTATRLPVLGTKVTAGETLYALDGNQPVVLLKGSTPVWRQMDSSSKSGVDIEQLETNLVALGFDPNKAIKVDKTWSNATTDAVKRWQKKLGLEQTGAVELGRVVFLPDTVRVAGVDIDPGASVAPGAAVLKVTATSPVVSIDLDATEQGTWPKGAKVKISLPNDETTTGTITEIGTVAQGGGDNRQGEAQKATVPVTVSLDDPSKVAYDGANLSVTVVTEQRKGVLAVPVAALLALAEGGFGVELVTSSGNKVVTVTTGLFADGYVEVTGNVAAGDKVVIP